MWPEFMGANNSSVSATLVTGLTNVTTAGTPVKLTTTKTLVESVKITAQKAVATANTGNILVGKSAAAGTNYEILPPVAIPTSAGDLPLASITISAPEGKKIDLSKIYIDAGTNGDGVTYFSIN